MEQTDVLECDKCKAICCSHPKGVFNSLEFPEAILDLADPNKNNECKNLTEEKRCSIYSNRPLECMLYPFMVDTNNNFFMATSCPSYKRTIELLQKKDIGTIDYLITKFNLCINQPKYVKELFESRILEYTTCIKINIKKFEEISNVKIHW